MSAHPEGQGGETAKDAPGETTRPGTAEAVEEQAPTVSSSATPSPGELSSAPLGRGASPSATPPWRSPPEGATPPSATPPWGSPPGGATPPWANPPWGSPPWGAPPPWYGWGSGGPGWPPSAPPTPAPAARRPLPWVIIGSLAAAIAMVALGLGIGYSVWGTGAPAVSRTGPATPVPVLPIQPPFGRGAFLGVVVVSPGGLGGTSAPPTVSTPGAHVVAVVPSSPAAKAGIVKGDVITEFDTHPVPSAAALRTDVLRLQPGSRVEVGWTTPSGAHESAQVTLAKRPTTGSVG